MPHTDRILLVVVIWNARDAQGVERLREREGYVLRTHESGGLRIRVAMHG